jgi:hypothetical protein
MAMRTDMQEVIERAHLVDRDLLAGLLPAGFVGQRRCDAFAGVNACGCSRRRSGWLPCPSQPQARHLPQAMPDSLTASQSNASANERARSNLPIPLLTRDQQRMRQLFPPCAQLLPDR